MCRVREMKMVDLQEFTCIAENPSVVATPGRAATARERFLTYFITFACYGARLHGDESGSVDRRDNLVGNLIERIIVERP